jgi:GH43 family beta-xylosidase
MTTEPSFRYCNPVHQGYFADPFVFRHEERYYAIGTTPAETGQSNVFPLLTSNDLASWRAMGPVMERLPAALGDTYWTPEIAWHGGIFYLYYSVGLGDRDHQLRVATSRRPDGLYRDAGVRLVAAEKAPFAIDPHPFRDDDGRWYLFYARDFLDFEPEQRGRRRVRAGTALVVQELLEMTRLGVRTAVVLRSQHDWQRYQSGRSMYGATFDWHTLEGPFVQKHQGRYYCFYSGGCWSSENYGVDFAVADDVWGPYTDEGAGEGPRVLRSVAPTVIGPGHNSIVTGPLGSGAFLVYHAWDRDMRERRMCIDPLRWSNAGPYCDGPSWKPRDAI